MNITTELSENGRSCQLCGGTGFVWCIADIDTCSNCVDNIVQPLRGKFFPLCDYCEEEWVWGVYSSGAQCFDCASTVAGIDVSAKLMMDSLK